MFLPVVDLLLFPLWSVTTVTEYTTLSSGDSADISTNAKKSVKKKVCKVGGNDVEKQWSLPHTFWFLVSSCVVAMGVICWMRPNHESKTKTHDDRFEMTEKSVCLCHP